MVNLEYCLTNLLFFDIPLLCYYTNLRSPIIFCQPSGDIYLSLGIYLSCFLIVSELLSCEVFETFVLLSAFLLPIKSPVAFLNYSF